MIQPNRRLWCVDVNRHESGRGPRKLGKRHGQAGNGQNPQSRPPHQHSFGRLAAKLYAFSQQRSSSKRRTPFWVRWALVCSFSFVGGAGFATFLAVVHQGWLAASSGVTPGQTVLVSNTAKSQSATRYGRPQLSPLPDPQEVWNCEVVVVGGSLGGIAAASHSMQSGATTCLIELSPWMGGQISSQGVSAIDESHLMWSERNFSESWTAFKRLIEQQPISDTSAQLVSQTNSCWVGRLCFPPTAGARASLLQLQAMAARAPGSRWGTSIAFKGAEFDTTGHTMTAIYAVRRIPRQPDYQPHGHFSKELASWYSWGSDDAFEKVPIRLQPPPGKRLIVIDATDTGEVVGWAGVPLRLGTESRATTGEPSASERDNPDCIQAYTYPFVLAIRDDRGASLSTLASLKPDYSREEHRRAYNLEGFPMFTGRSFFNYRRIISTLSTDPFTATPAPNDMTVVNWNAGNDWSSMNPPLLLTDEQLEKSGQRQNWLGGMSVIALKHAEEHALLFAQWLLETQSQPDFPLSFLAGPSSPMGTESGLSMLPYIREGRRIIGRKAYGQREFAIREGDIRRDLEGRDFSRTTVAATHYAIDMHGCRYRNWEPSGEATAAPAKEAIVRPVLVPLESLIPQTIDNLLVGGKSIAATHIANAVTRVHYSEWSIGAAAGSTAGWLIRTQPKLLPADIVPNKMMPALQQHLVAQGLRAAW